MEAKQHDMTPFVELMSQWYSPELISKTLDDVIFFFVVKRMEEGNAYKCDAEQVTLLKDLRDAFRKT